MAKPFKRKKKPLSQAQALSELSENFKSLGDSQMERMELWLKAEKQREDSFLAFQERQAQLNRDHELRMMQLMANLQAKPPQPSYQTLMPARPVSPYGQPVYPSGCFPDDLQQEGRHYTDL